MKKIYYSFLCIFLCTTSVYSQSEGISLPKEQVKAPRIFNLPGFTKISNSPNRGIGSRWYNYGEAMDATLGGEVGTGPSQLEGNYLFPDSTMQVEYTTGNAGTWIHKIADVLDVSSFVFNDVGIYPNQLFMDNTKSFQLDSLGILLIYSRPGNNSNIVDTLLVEVAVNTTLSTSMFTSATAPQLGANLQSDTVFFKSLPYNYTTNTLDIPERKTYKIPLTEETFADSLENGTHYIKLATEQNGISCPAGSVVVCSYSFIPGYSWNANSSLMKENNSVNFLSFKENPDLFPMYTKKDWNVSYIIPQNVKYNIAGGWNGKFIPSFAYMGGTDPTYAYEHHAIYYKISDPNVSINGIENPEAVFKISQNTPNPASINTTLSYEIPVSANVRLSVYDITGREVILIDEGKKAAGKHQLILNISGLTSGVYYYTASAGANKITRKMIISK